MHRSVLIYAAGVASAGAVTVVMAAVQWNSQSFDHFLVCLGLALLGARLKVKIPGLNSCISPSFVPVFLALGSMSWAETVVMAALAGVVQSLGRQTVLQVVFNGGTLALAAGSAYGLSHALAGGSVALYLVAATVFQLVNIVTVSGVLSLAASGSLWEIWRNCHFWSYPYHLTGAAVAAVWIQSENATSIGSMALVLAVMLYLLSVFYGEVTRRATL